MKFKALEYFVALAESSSINEAAQKLYIAQPSLTKALQLFEKEIGVSLFRRSSAGITLTEAGKKILPEARQILEIYNGWLRLSEMQSLQSLDVYVHSSFSDFLLPNTVLRFREKNPNVNVRFITRNDPMQVISRDSNRPTIGMFICEEREQLPRLSKLQGNPPLVLFRGEYRCLVSPNSPLAKKDSVTVEDLRDYFLVLPMMEEILAEDCFLSDLIKRIISTSSQQRIIEVESLANVTALVSGHPETYALSFYPALERYNEVVAKKLVHVPFEGQMTWGSLCLFYSRQTAHQHQAIQEFVIAVQAASDQFLADCEEKIVSDNI